MTANKPMNWTAAGVACVTLGLYASAVGNEQRSSQPQAAKKEMGNVGS